MADNFIQVAADGVGKKMQTYLNTIGADSVHAEAVVLVNSSGSPLGTTGDALNVYLGSINVAAGTNLNTSLLATAAKQTDGSQKTQIVDPTNASNIAGITAGALNVYLASITANAGTNLNTANISVKQFTAPVNMANGQVTASTSAGTL